MTSFHVWLQTRACKRCGHQRVSHLHYRRGMDCGCGCKRYRWF